MTRYDFTQSIENSLPYFFPELKNKKIFDCVTIEYKDDNWLILSIIFHKYTFDSIHFRENLNKFNRFLGVYEINVLENSILPDFDFIQHRNNEDYQTETHYYKVPISIAQGFSS